MRSQPSPPTVERDPSIDVLRGLLVAALVFVEHLPASAEHGWLRHSPWDGVRTADFVFPGFLFVVGSSMAAASRVPSWASVARRVGLLLALGLVFNAATETSPLRLTGVLQTIAVAGLLATVLTRRVRRASDVALVAGALLALHGVVLDDGFAVDRWALPDARLYREGAAGHDPEGVLNTVLGATAVVLLGFAATRGRTWRFAGALAVAAALAWLVWEPNKRAWTPTFSLLMAATFSVALVVLRAVGTRAPVLAAVGRNALVVYVGQHLVREVLGDRPFEAVDDVAYAVAATVAWSATAVALGRLGVRLRL